MLALRIPPWLIPALLAVPLIALDAQSARRFPLVHVAVVSFAARGDTLDVAYRVQNDATSPLELWTFALETPATVVRLSAPADGHDWQTGQRHGDEPMPMWIASGDNLRAGETATGLHMVGVGITGLVEYLAVPDLSQVTDSIQDTLPHDQMREYATRDTIVAIVPKPKGATPSSQLARLQSFLTLSCGKAAWITQAEVCHSLQQKLSLASTAIAGGNPATARGLLTMFVSELAAQYGPEPDKPVTPAAYALLRPNAVLLMSLL